MRKILLATAALAVLAIAPVQSAPAPAAAQAGVAKLDPKELHFRNIRQLTFGGENAEAYWSADGKEISFQSTRAPFKCDQQFTMNADGTNVKLLSTGKGRTTCGYFFPDGKRMIYASTHLDSPDCPMPPNMSEGYVWAI